MLGEGQGLGRRLGECWRLGVTNPVPRGPVLRAGLGQTQRAGLLTDEGCSIDDPLPTHNPPIYNLPTNTTYFAHASEATPPPFDTFSPRRFPLVIAVISPPPWHPRAPSHSPGLVLSPASGAVPALPSPSAQPLHESTQVAAAVAGGRGWGKVRGSESRTARQVEVVILRGRWTRPKTLGGWEWLLGVWGVA